VVVVVVVAVHGRVVVVDVLVVVVVEVVVVDVVGVVVVVVAVHGRVVVVDVLVVVGELAAGLEIISALETSPQAAISATDTRTSLVRKVALTSLIYRFDPTAQGRRRRFDDGHRESLIRVRSCYDAVTKLLSLFADG
jgi:hypothetical protein